VLTLHFENLLRKAAALGASIVRLFTESAGTRGMTLLRDWLSPEQRSQFEKTRSFLVVGCDTGKRYCIRYGTATNVFEIDEKGYTGIGWCFLPSGNLVAGDVMLAQKNRFGKRRSFHIASSTAFPREYPAKMAEPSATGFFLI